MRAPVVFDPQKRRFHTVATFDTLFAERVAALREGRGWSQARLAGRVNELAGLKWNQSTVQKIERQLRQVTVREAFLLAAALDAAPVDLFAPLEQGARAHVTLRHPDLPGQEINVPQSTATVLQKSGWTPISEAHSAPDAPEDLILIGSNYAITPQQAREWVTGSAPLPPPDAILKEND
jgi:transcriptional regulator with XRE-family HTH domain